MPDLNLEREAQRIEEFIRSRWSPPQSLILGASGGLDSDVVARLCIRVAGPKALHLYIALQEDLDPAHIFNARELAKDLCVPLVELDLEPFPRQLVTTLQKDDPRSDFDPRSILDLGKAKNALRTWVHAMYAERGHLIVGTSNRTEIETGFYLPFGDGLSHIMPIAHLYKTQVRLLAQVLGTRSEVIQQAPSAGYWPGESDLEDLAVWLFHGEPVLAELHLSPDDLTAIKKIQGELTFEALDHALLTIARGGDLAAVTSTSGLHLERARRLMRLVANVPRVKGRPLGVRLDNLNP